MIHLPIKPDYCGRYNGVFISACPFVSLTVSIWLCVGLITSGCESQPQSQPAVHNPTKSLSFHDPSRATCLTRQTQDQGCSTIYPPARIPCTPSAGILSSLSSPSSASPAQRRWNWSKRCLDPGLGDMLVSPMRMARCEWPFGPFFL
jgi:hypothetical protein